MENFKIKALQSLFSSNILMQLYYFMKGGLFEACNGIQWLPVNTDTTICTFPL